MIYSPILLLQLDATDEESSLLFFDFIIQIRAVELISRETPKRETPNRVDFARDT